MPPRHFQNDETAEQPIAKIGFKVEFPPCTKPRALSSSVRTVSHKDEASQVVDPAQSKLPFDSLGEGETATISSGGKIIVKFTGSRSPGVMSGHIQNPLWLSHWPAG